jgi:Succinate dehydrogenase/fumarate reductase, flavoprotein subunit
MRLDPSMQRSLVELAEVDLVVLGSGAGGLTAALTATLEGLTVAVLEISPLFGGTTARSSGTVWIPNNQLMRAAGFAPDADAAKTYLSGLVAEHAPSEGWLAFLEQAPQMQADLETRAGIAFRPYLAAPDYHSALEGAAPGGRAVEPAAFDGRSLGGWFEKLAEPMRELTVLGGMMLTRAEAQRLIWAERSPVAMLEGLRLLARHVRDRGTRYRRGTRLVMGNALAARLLHGVLTRGGLAFTHVHVHQIRMDAGRAAGVSGVHGGRPFSLRARAGVVLAGGGFPADPEMRSRYLPPMTPPHTPAGPFSRGSTIRLGVAAGGCIGPDAGSNAFWFPSSLWVRPGGGIAVYPHIALDRAKPGSIIVDQNGERFANEALSYHDFCSAMFRHGATACPAWMIAGGDFIRRYGLGVIRPRTPSLGAYLRSGYLKTAEGPDALAQALGMPPGSLGRSIAQFNDAARQGRDADFRRGETAYEVSNGDASRSPDNPCLGEVATGRLYAVALWPTPLATARGLLCGGAGEVLDRSGRPIPGLYAAGNDMQSVFGGQYPGAGAQIGPAMTFGWAAARHAARHMQDIDGRVT